MRIAFEQFEVAHLRGRQAVGPAFRAFPFGKPVADNLLPEMAEGGIADVMGETGGGDDMPEVRGAVFAAFQMPVDDDLPGIGAKRTANGGHFHGMGEAGAHIVAFGERMHLRLVLQPPEGGGKDNTVLILVKGAARGDHRILVILTETAR